MITWLMVGLLLFTESACDRGKNAVSNKNGKNESASSSDKASVKATASTDEEDIYRLTCYTCVNVSDNKMCNEWAIDTPCPAANGDFCRSLHILDSRGKSVLVSKSCANKIECSPGSVGCVPVDTQKICISCCDTSYCNVESPTNATNATFSRRRPDRTKGLKKRKKKKRKKSRAGSAADEQTPEGPGQPDDAEDPLDEEDDEEPESSGSASPARASARLCRLLLLLLGAAASLLLNRAYH